MEQFAMGFVGWLEISGWYAPLLFIAFHLFRPLLFLPVVLLCISGGVLFGAIAGTIYSVIGITLSSTIFYRIIKGVPGVWKRLTRLKNKMLKKNTSLTVRQVAVLRLVPFIHFHLLSLCLIEICTDFKEYVRASFVSNLPLAFVYTTVGQWLSKISIPMMVVFMVMLGIITFLFRRKQYILSWNDFFQPNT
ncbi:TVP38/TMEM64 family protein [Thalassobacillus pellis]|uniref:TVP38/TMEM64 family protein n=1 Tax=Thalassobacillus pellis TaxID=748008 RepID=UPI001960EC62|nr:VTT domain-containing protein [Thalassobacillus pellis]MBM7555009.1 putative membrane protein YdjX (TVP38/TMEM64 family) [Thalassobacillus pellis]